ncbi:MULTISPECIES: acyl carrier protein [unclassified Nocardia]|uniref:acyl carrier protein n=1 Tax=unclassified Nocardia TaxID=2637762 RepID=UPI001CE48E5D|nr:MULTISPECIES: phosphopantetheine-binding protein [unclassified Nocardia]
MSTERVIEDLLTLFADVVGDPAVHGIDTARGDMDVWDSLAQVRLVYAVERHFGVELPGNLLTSEVSLAEVAAAISAAREADVS